MLHGNVPVVAAVNGAAVGWGMELAMMADIRVASERAKFAGADDDSRVRRAHGRRRHRRTHDGGDSAEDGEHEASARSTSHAAP